MRRVLAVVALALLSSCSDDDAGVNRTIAPIPTPTGGCKVIQFTADYIPDGFVPGESAARHPSAETNRSWVKDKQVVQILGGVDADLDEDLDFEDTEVRGFNAIVGSIESSTLVISWTEPAFPNPCAKQYEVVGVSVDRNELRRVADSLRELNS